MAYLRRRSGSKYWFAQWTHPLTKSKITRSTKIEAKAGNRRRAQEIAEEYEEETKKLRTEIQVRKVLNDLHTRSTGNSVLVKSIREVMEEWIANQSGGVSANSIASYSGSIQQFLEWLGDRSGMEVNLITQKDIVDFRNSTEQDRSAATVNKHLKLLRRIFADASKKAYISTDPTEGVNTVKRKKKTSQRKAFTVGELNTLMEVASPEWKSMIRFSLYTGGQRLGDIALLLWDSIDLKKHVIQFYTEKTNRHIVVPIISPLLKHIKALLKNRGDSKYVHSDAATNFLQRGSAGLSNQFAMVLYRAGLRETPPQANRKEDDPNYKTGRRTPSALSFHSLRATAATMLHTANVPPVVVQDIVGHDSAEVHAAYVKLGIDNVRGALSNLPSI